MKITQGWVGRLALGSLWLIASASGEVQAQAQAQAVSAPPASRLETLGERLFTDRNLSVPAGTSCASCHAANTGFANNNGSNNGVARGSLPTSIGSRNAMSNAYSAFVPPFSFRINGAGRVEPVGGHFWDGRADTLAIQAQGPFLNALEMNNPNAAAVVAKVAASNYADLMRAEFGTGIFATPDLAFQKIAIAIAAFEGSTPLQAFSAKYDAVVQKKASFTAAEARGLALFQDRNKGNCASCHRMDPANPNPRASLFTDFSFVSTGVPRNAAIAENANATYFDLGLCGPVRTRPALTANVPANVSIEQFCGSFRTVTLRNAALRKAFMHNGVFKNLNEVVSFYATRNSNPTRWYGATGIANDVPAAYLGNIINDRPPFNRPRNGQPVLTAAEIADVVSFLETLTDGFTASGTATAPVGAPPVPPVAPGPPGQPGIVGRPPVGGPPGARPGSPPGAPAGPPSGQQPPFVQVARSPF